MPSWFEVKARSVWVLGVALVLAGLVPVISFVLHSLLPGAAAALGSVPQFSAPGLAELQASLPAKKLTLAEGQLPGLVFAVLGVALMAIGQLLVHRQKAALHAVQRRREDRLRRVRAYREARVEPFLGAEAPAGAAQDSAPGRRVA